MPVMPGINDGEAVLGPLFEKAKAAGAVDVCGAPLFLRGATRAVFFPWLEQEFPGLVALYRRLFERSDYLGSAAKDELLATYRRLKLEQGFPRPLAGRA